MADWKGDTAASARRIANAQAKFQDREHNRRRGIMATDLQKRAAKTLKGLNESKYYKLVEGENTFRILPTPANKKGEGEVYIEYYQHMNVGSEERACMCGKDPLTGDGECWICDTYIPKLSKKGKDERAAALAPKKFMAIQIAKIDGEKMKGPILWNVPQINIQRMLMTVISSTKRPYLNPKKGYNVTIKRTGTTQRNTKYFGPESDEDTSRVPSSILEKLVPFSRIKEMRQYDEDYQKQLVYGSSELADEEEEETPKKKKVISKKSRDEDEDDEDLEDDDEDLEEDEDEEEEEKPRKKKVKSKKSSKDEEEDEDDDEDLDEDDEDEDDSEGDEDEDEEEETPKKKSKSKVKAKAKKRQDEDEDDEDEDVPF